MAKSTNTALFLLFFLAGGIPHPLDIATHFQPHPLRCFSPDHRRAQRSSANLRRSHRPTHRTTRERVPSVILALLASLRETLLPLRPLRPLRSLRSLRETVLLFRPRPPAPGT